MAIFHCQVKPISRGAGRSCTAAAAYRACEKLQDQYTGIQHDFTRKAGLVESYILTPDKSEISRQELWSLAEAAEKRRDSRTAREYEIALPHELPKEEALACAKKFAQALVATYGCAADVCVHGHGAGDRRNLHAHILTTTRKLEAGKLTEKTLAELSGQKLKAQGGPKAQDQIKIIRAKWADIVNVAMREHNLPEISPLSLQAQGIERQPQAHLGPHAAAMERRGIQTRIGNENRRARGEQTNDDRELNELKEEIKMLTEIEKEIDQARGELPSMVAQVRAEQAAERREAERKKQQELARQKQEEKHSRSMCHSM